MNPTPTKDASTDKMQLSELKYLEASFLQGVLDTPITVNTSQN